MRAQTRILDLKEALLKLCILDLKHGSRTHVFKNIKKKKNKIVILIYGNESPKIK